MKTPKVSTIQTQKFTRLNSQFLKPEIAKGISERIDRSPINNSQSFLNNMTNVNQSGLLVSNRLANEEDQDPDIVTFNTV